MKLAIDRSHLTYKQVRLILAVLDGWQKGRIHFESAGLVVEAVTDGAETPDSVIVRSPAVGTFTPEVLAGTDGAKTVSSGSRVGRVDAPLRSTPVFAAEEGRVVAMLVQPDTFVEFDQPLLILERTAV